MNWAIDLPCQRVRRENQHEHHNRSLVSPRSDRASDWGLKGCYRRGSGGANLALYALPLPTGAGTAFQKP
jgi:hypothetical protein